MYSSQYTSKERLGDYEHNLKVSLSQVESFPLSKIFVTKRKRKIFKNFIEI
jgi:hypothetical protein